MQACPESCIDDLVAKIVRLLEVPYGIQVPSRSVGVKAVDIEVQPLGTEEAAAEDLSHCGRDRSMRGRVFRMVRRNQERAPARLFGCRWVAVVKSRDGTETVSRDRRRIDGGNRAPE